MRIGIDCDGVLRNFIPDLINKIEQTHPQHSNKILIPTSWDWEQWLPFWTEEETEKYVFDDHYISLFGSGGTPIISSIEDWPKLKKWSTDNNHQLCLVSAQRDNCKHLTTVWLEENGFDFDEIHYTHDKWEIDVDVLIDDSPNKLKSFKKKSIVNGNPIRYKQTWNTKCHKKYMSIDRLSDLIDKLFG